MPKFTPIISTDKEKVRPKELMKLWASVEWSGENDYAPQTVKAAIRNTSLLVSARNQYGELIGMARVMSDNVFVTYLAELIVHPDYQGCGIGKRLLKVVKEYYENTSIVLITGSNNRRFYKKCGMKESKLLIFYNY